MFRLSQEWFGTWVALLISCLVFGFAHDDAQGATLQGSEWLTGGAFGAEASLVALAIRGSVGALMLAKAVRRGRIVPPPWKRKG